LAGHFEQQAKNANLVYETAKNNLEATGINDTNRNNFNKYSADVVNGISQNIDKVLDKGGSIEDNN
jgi:hypothetical protein